MSRRQHGPLRERLEVAVVMLAVVTFVALLAGGWLGSRLYRRQAWLEANQGVVRYGGRCWTVLPLGAEWGIPVVTQRGWDGAVVIEYRTRDAAVLERVPCGGGDGE